MSEPFLLEWDFSDLGDEEFFAYLVEFLGHEDIVELALTRHYDLPPHIFFTGNFYKLRYLDYPYNSVRWPIMSTAMLSALKEVGRFAHRDIPVTMLDDTVPSSELFLESGEPNTKYVLERFVAIQLLDHLDVFDWENSIYTRSQYSSTRTTEIRKLVLKSVPGGFPPIFRISAYPVLLFVSAETRRALEESGIKGVAFRAISDYPYKNPKK